MRKMLGTLLMGGVLIAPTALKAFQQTEERTTTTTTETKRYYDPVYKQYHVWDSEDRAYHMYYQENHRTYEEYPKTTVTEQREYWKCRHGHPNRMLFKSETEEQH